MNCNRLILLGSNLLEECGISLLRFSTAVAYCFLAAMAFGLSRANSCVISTLCTPMSVVLISIYMEALLLHLSVPALATTLLSAVYNEKPNPLGKGEVAG